MLAASDVTVEPSVRSDRNTPCTVVRRPRLQAHRGVHTGGLKPTVHEDRSFEHENNENG